LEDPWRFPPTESWSASSARFGTSTLRALQADLPKLQTKYGRQEVLYALTGLAAARPAQKPIHERPAAAAIRHRPKGPHGRSRSGVSQTPSRNDMHKEDAIIARARERERRF
jgi:hypothetical protein